MIFNKQKKSIPFKVMNFLILFCDNHLVKDLLIGSSDFFLFFSVSSFCSLPLLYHRNHVPSFQSIVTTPKAFSFSFNDEERSGEDKKGGKRGRSLSMEKEKIVNVKKEGEEGEENKEETLLSMLTSGGRRKPVDVNLVRGIEEEKVQFDVEEGQKEGKERKEGKEGKGGSAKEGKGKSKEGKKQGKGGSIGKVKGKTLLFREQRKDSEKEQGKEEGKGGGVIPTFVTRHTSYHSSLGEFNELMPIARKVREELKEEGAAGGKGFFFLLLWIY